ncbi:MAG: ABC transporter substrate-binding protein [Wenzhouxiangella sp.]|nr:MAG: ABC transporter substrate-binding protein [Wenzhouxiangella sp.]
MTLRFLTLLLLATLLSPLAWGQDRPTVVVTFSILEDFAARVAGEHANVVNLTPRGAEVHEYELRPDDFRALERADLVFYLGLDLEQWMGQLRAVVGSDTPVVAVAEVGGIETLPIVAGEYRGQADPHVWMDPQRAGKLVEAMYRQLAELLPDQAEFLRANAEAYRDELDGLYREMIEVLDAIPAERRVLITSEAAFVYFADAFDFFHDGIWGSNAETEGSPRQLMRITDVINERQPPAIFWESTISSRHVESISADTGVPYRGPLHVDSLDAEGSAADSYAGMMRENARLLREALGDDR